MKISSVLSHSTYQKNFKRNQYDRIETHVKQVLFENFEDINTQTFNKSKKIIENELLPEFKKELISKKGYISNDDLNTIFYTLANVYERSGIEKDAAIFKNIVQK